MINGEGVVNINVNVNSKMEISSFPFKTLLKYSSGKMEENRPP